MPYQTNCSWLAIDKLPPTEKNIFIAVDFPHIQKILGVIIIQIQCEPRAILEKYGIYKLFTENYQNYDVLLTYDEEMLKLPNAKFYLFGTCWIKTEVYNNIDITKKQLRISSLTGNKEFTLAHTYRKFLYMNQLFIPLPITWFRSSKDKLLPMIQFNNNPILKSGKEQLFLNYQFSLVIENSRQNNYFSEKLIDCLITKTIPIYYGCPNISNWFDVRGWIILETTDINELIQKTSKLPVYMNYINVINENYERAKEYVYFEKNIQRAINFGEDI